jgi:hypothetical protein
MGKCVATERLISGNQLITNLIAMAMETESCEHLKTQAVAWELKHSFRDNRTEEL